MRRDGSRNPGYALFERLSIAEIVRTLEEKQSLSAQSLAGGKFQNVLEQRVGYWEKRVPKGKDCFVHLCHRNRRCDPAAFDRLKTDSGDLVLLGIYHIEPQSRPILTVFRSATRRIIGASANISR